MPRKYYQTEWQGIRFTEFSELSETKPADAEFYRKFYDTFFSRYHAWEDMSAGWRSEKKKLSSFIASRVHDHARVLSVGCGLGIVEHFIKLENPSIDLYINEVAGSAWKFIEKEFDTGHKCLGFVPDCVPDDISFDLVYLIAVDYALEDNDLAGLLAGIRKILKPGGECLLVSASLDKRAVTLKEKLVSALMMGKRLVSKILHPRSWNEPKQLWGWKRTTQEYKTLMERAGYKHTEEGYTQLSGASMFWISGR